MLRYDCGIFYQILATLKLLSSDQLLHAAKCLELETQLRRNVARQNSVL